MGQNPVEEAAINEAVELLVESVLGDDPDPTAAANLAALLKPGVRELRARDAARPAPAGVAQVADAGVSEVLYKAHVVAAGRPVSGYPRIYTNKRGLSAVRGAHQRSATVTLEQATVTWTPYIP